MDFCFLKGGAASFLQARLNDSWPAGGKDLKVKLYTNTIALVNTLEAADFTEVASEAGYEAKTLTCGNWNIPADGSANTFVAEARYPPQSFFFTDALSGGLTIKGYFVTDADDIALWAYEFDDPFVAGPGLICGVYPKLNLTKRTVVGVYQKLFNQGAIKFLEVRLNDYWFDSQKNMDLYVLGRSDAMGLDFFDNGSHDGSNVVDSNFQNLVATLTCGNWTIDTTSSATYSEQQWAFTAPISSPEGGYILGYVLSPSNLASLLEWGVGFESGYQPDDPDILGITPTITLIDGTPE